MVEIIQGIRNTLVKRIFTFQFSTLPAIVQPPKPVIGNWGRVEENSVFRAENRAAQAQLNKTNVCIIIKDDYDSLISYEVTKEDIYDEYNLITINKIGFLNYYSE